MAAVQWSGVSYHIHENTYARQYLPTARFVEQHSSPDSLVIGPAGFFWTLWGKRPFVNDLRLGYFTGKRADVIVIDNWYRTVLLNATGEIEPARNYARRLLSEDYDPKWTEGQYTVYLRKGGQMKFRMASLSVK
jgi:hypothetical protein